jgi:hypothetical protein
MFMQITIGKFKGSTVGAVVLKHADYCKWVLDQRGATGPLAKVKAEAERLISILDGKQILGSCSHSGCQSPPVRFSAYRESSNLPHRWCGACNPYSTGAVPGSLSIITTYRQALSHVESRCAGRQGDYVSIIREIAVAKGLSKRITEKDIATFFGP